MRIVNALFLLSFAAFTLGGLLLIASALRFWYDTLRDPTEARPLFMRGVAAIRGEFPNLSSARLLRKAVRMIIASWLLGTAFVVIRVLSE